MRRTTLRFQVFLSILGVALGTALTVGLFARTALSSAFEGYLRAQGGHQVGMGRVGMGRMMLGAAEQAFVSSVDRGVLWAALIATVAAMFVAVLLAMYLSRPLRRLKGAAEGLGRGDLGHRVEADGPLEVASLGEAFNRMADSLEAAEELRKRLVADVAHELRNPLAAARAQAEGMADGVLSVDVERLNSVAEDLQHLSLMVDDLQELAVAEAGRLSYQMTDVDISALIEQEANRVRGGVRSGVRLLTRTGTGSAMVRADEKRIGQVLRNLLTNASRHTDEGSITIDLEERGDRLEVRVSDTGQGIDPRDLPHIFERFYRADAARAAETGGTGLGLAISRTIVSDHGGDVFASSEPGRGTTIGFWLPGRQADSGDAPPSA